MSAWEPINETRYSVGSFFLHSYKDCFLGVTLLDELVYVKYMLQIFWCFNAY